MATVMCCIWVLIYWYSYGHIRKQYHQVGYALETFPALSKIIVTYSKYRRVAEIQIFEKTYLIVIKDETGLKFKMNVSTLFLIGSYDQKLVASY